MNSWANILFYLVFLSQIFLISHFVPRLILSRIDTLLRDYPPSTHPRLYPKPVEYYRIGRAAFHWGNRLILLFGFVVLFGVITLDGGTAADDGYISEAWPAAYGILQFLPLMALELFGYRQFRWMRQSNTARTRSAELRPRRLFELVSPGLFTLALILCGVSVGFDLSLHDFSLAWDNGVAQRSLVLIATNVLLLAAGLWCAFGRRLDPHMSSTDRSRQVGTQLKSLLFVSMAVSVFMLFHAADAVFDLDYLDAPLISLYFQVVVAVSIGHVMRKTDLSGLDFDVYRAEQPQA